MVVMVGMLFRFEEFTDRCGGPPKILCEAHRCYTGSSVAKTKQAAFHR